MSYGTLLSTGITSYTYSAVSFVQVAPRVATTLRKVSFVADVDVDGFKTHNGNRALKGARDYARLASEIRMNMLLSPLPQST